MERLIMGSRNPYPKPEDPELLIVKRVFFEVWTVIAAHEPYRDYTLDHDRRVALSWKLMALAAEGATEPGELRSLAIESLQLPRSH
jgi:hypothetical protein